MSVISTHVLDTSRGEPARGLVVRLERAGQGTEIGRGTTDRDGRISDFGTAPLPGGTYRLVFETRAYLEAAGGGSDRSAGPAETPGPADPPGSPEPPGGSASEPFFPEVVVTFAVDGERPHYHVPLLLSPYSYSTYRGS